MKKILFVDDDPTQLFLFEKNFKTVIFDKFMASLIVVNSAKAAMNLINQDMDKEIVLAIIDLMMPGTCGIDLSKMVYEIRPDIFIILSSSIGINEEIKNAPKEIPSIWGCIELPHIVEDIIKKIELLLKAA